MSEKSQSRLNTTAEEDRECKKKRICVAAGAGQDFKQHMFHGQFG